MTKPGLALKPRWRNAGPWLALLVWPFMLALSNSKWLYSGLWYDPFIYLGAYLRLPEQLHDWGNFYYYSRLAFLLPGYVFYHLLPASLANIGLDLSRWYLGIFALFALLRRLIGMRAGLFTALLLGGYSHFLVAIGQDYPDGVVVVFLVLALWASTRALASPKPGRWLFISGLALGGGLHAHLFSMVVWPAFGLYLLLARPAAWGWRRLIAAGVWILLGIAALTVALGMVSWLMGGNPLFFLGTLGFLENGANQPNILFVPPSLIAALPAASFLMAPALVFGVGAVTLAREWSTQGWRWRSSSVVIFCCCHMAVVLALLLVGVRGTTTLLNRAYYVSYVLPFMALALGSLLAGALGRLSNRQWLTLVGVLMAAVPAGLALSVRLSVESIGWVGSYRGWITLGGFLAALVVLLLSRLNVWGLLSLAAIFAVLNPIVPGIQDSLALDDRQARKDGFEFVVRSVDLIASRWNPQTWLIFNEARDPAQSLVACALSVCHQNIVSRDYPGLNIQYSSLSAISEFQPGRQFIVLSDQPEDLAQAIRASGESVTAPILEAADTVQAGNATGYVSFYREPVENWAMELLPGRSMGFPSSLAQADAGDGSIATRPNDSTAGPLAYGSQLQLPAGRYQALFTLAAVGNSSPDPVAYAQISGSAGTAALNVKSDIRGADFGDSAHPVDFKLVFTLGPQGGTVAPLVYCYGKIPLRFLHFQLMRVSS